MNTCKLSQFIDIRQKITPKKQNGIKKRSDVCENRFIENSYLSLDLSILFAEIIESDLFSKSPLTIMCRCLNDSIDLRIKPLNLYEVSTFCCHTDDTSFTFIGSYFSTIVAVIVSELNQFFDAVIYLYLCISFEFIHCLTFDIVDISDMFQKVGGDTIYLSCFN